MLLHSLEIQNFRSLEHIKLDNLQGFNVLIGRNNAGKSSVFQALYDLIGVFLQGRNISLDVITDRDASRPFEVILTFKPSYQERGEFASLLVADVDEPRKAGMLDSPLLCKVQFSFKTPISSAQQMHLRETRILAENGQWATIQKMAGQEHLNNPEQKYVLLTKVTQDIGQNIVEAALVDIDRSGHVTSQQFSYNQLFTSWSTDPAITWLYAQLRKYFTDSFFFTPFRHSVPILTVAQTNTLAQDGANLAQVLHTLITNDRETFEQIEQFVHEPLPEVGRMQTPLINTTTNITFRASARTPAIPVTDMGGGVEQLLMIATVLLKPEMQTHTLFIEEPESHLHAGAQRFLIEQLCSGTRQVFITTHSPIFISIPRPYSLYQVINKKGRTKTKRCDPALLDAVLEGIGVRNSDVLLSDAVLFVEGNSDRDVITLFSEQLNMSLAERYVNVLPMGGGRYAERGAPIRSDLLKDISNRAPVPHLFLLDRDERRREEINNLEERLGTKVHVLKAREMENYLLIPHAILGALTSKCCGDQTLLERLTGITEEYIQQLIQRAADDLYSLVLIKRIRNELGGLRDGLLPSAVASTLLAHSTKPNLPQLLREAVQSQFTQHLASLDIEHIILTEQQELDAAWSDPEKRLLLAPGEEILVGVFTALGFQYNKRADTPSIAREMKADEIDQEIIKVIEKARALVGK